MTPYITDTKNDKCYVIYCREYTGFKTEGDTWSSDIVDAELFTEAEVQKVANSLYALKPVILKWTQV